MFLYRPGNRAQFSVLLSAEAAVSAPIRKLQTWLPEHLAEDLSVPALARRAAMSPRTFQRIFTQGNRDSAFSLRREIANRSGPAQARAHFLKT